MLLQRFVHQKKQFEECLPESRDIGMFRLDTQKIKEKFTPQTKECMNKLRDLLPQVVQ